MQLQDDAFSQALENAFESQLGKIKAVSKRVSIPLRQRHAKYYIKSGFALIGDAAHTIHPLAGQGVNLGLADAMVLAEELIKAANSGVNVGDTRILARFERRRQGSNLAMMGVMEGFKRLFSADDVSLRWLRNTGLKLFDQSTFIKKELISQAMGERVRVPLFERQ
jgi:2-octaprenylphenol hydroxylase